MIPSDVANTLRLLAPDLKSATQAQAQTQPVVASQRIADILGNLVPGQRLFAEIQALLPNGTYRAVVAQRDITLALPFSAKPGDSLELEVVDSDGKITLAVVARQGTGQPGGAPSDSVSTTLSSTGKMIGNLLAGIDDQGKRAAPAPLNGNQPLTEAFTGKAADLAPALKDALVKSGVFYEAHQARWVAGRLPTAQLLLEPQGQHSLPTAALSGLPQNAALQLPPGTPGNTMPTAPNEALLYELPAIRGEKPPGTTPAAEGPPHQAIPPSTANPAELTSLAPSPTGEKIPDTAAQLAASASRPMPPMPTNTTPGSIPADLTPIVQQQLDALATQTFAWQGQVWPGQQMFWEIDEQQDGAQGRSDENPGQWQTRLKLNLPRMGGIEATLSLQPGNEVRISIATHSDGSESLLTAAGEQLRQQFESAGLNLSSLTVKHGTTTE
ncbi:MAG: flagellar hook-length control protein FliK [Azonexus sp.]